MFRRDGGAAENDAGERFMIGVEVGDGFDGAGPRGKTTVRLHRRRWYDDDKRLRTRR